MVAKGWWWVRQRYSRTRAHARALTRWHLTQWRCSPATNLVRCMQRDMVRVCCMLTAASYAHLGILRTRSLPPRTALPLRYSLARALAIGLAPPPRTATHPAAHELRARARRLVQSGSDLRVKLALKGINLLDRHAALANEQHGPSSSSPVAHIGLSGGAWRSFAAGSRREPAVTGRCDSCRRPT